MLLSKNAALVRGFAGPGGGSLWRTRLRCTPLPAELLGDGLRPALLDVHCGGAPFGRCVRRCPALPATALPLPAADCQGGAGAFLHRHAGRRRAPAAAGRRTRGHGERVAGACRRASLAGGRNAPCRRRPCQPCRAASWLTGTDPLHPTPPSCQVFLLYHFEREVQPAVKKSDWEKRPFGAHMDVAKMVSLQVTATSPPPAAAQQQKQKQQQQQQQGVCSMKSRS